MRFRITVWGSKKIKNKNKEAGKRFGVVGVQAMSMNCE